MLWIVSLSALFIGVKWSSSLGGLSFVVGYLLSCWWFPLANCLCCDGKGKHRRKDGKVFRRCWWCDGRGARRRVGRAAWEMFAR